MQSSSEDYEYHEPGDVERLSADPGLGFQPGRPPFLQPSSSQKEPRNKAYAPVPVGDEPSPRYLSWEGSSEETEQMAVQPSLQKTKASSKSELLHDLQQMPQHHSKRSLLQEWAWELCTWLLATVSLGTILALLIIFDNKPLSSWRSRISLNATLAILAVVTQSALLFSLGKCIGQLKWDWFRAERDVMDMERFDDASRGPLGSLELLWNQLVKQKSFHFVSLGALATIFVATCSPFTQQAVSIDDARLVVLDQDALIGQCFNYTKPGDINGSGNYRITDEGYISQVEPVIFNSISSGMVGTTSFSNLTGSCRTGNCTWEPYSTLGMCATSRDATSMIRMPTNCTSSSVVSPSGNGPCDIEILPPYIPDKSAVGSFQSKRTGFIGPAMTGTGNKNTFWIGHQYYRSGMLDIYVIYENIPWVSRYDDNRTWAAVHGTLQPCVMELNTTVVNGRANTTVLRQELIGDGKCAKLYNHELCAGAGILDGWFEFAHALAMGFTGQVLIYGPGGDNYFTGEFASNVFEDIYGSQVFTTHDATAGLSSGIESKAPLFEDGIPGLRGFAARLDSFAASVTNGMRQSLGASGFAGDTQVLRTFITVNLFWMFPPVFLWLLTTVFLFATMRKTKRSGAPLWKSSPLVALFCLNHEAGIPSARLVAKHLEKNGHDVVLRETGHAWRLEKT